MNKNKVSRSNGFLSNFFYEYWEIIKEDLIEVVRESRSSKMVFKDLNNNLLPLIPKKENANSLDAFRGTSFCKMVYKVISKVIAIK